MRPNPIQIVRLPVSIIAVAPLLFLTTTIYAQGVPETDNEKAFYSIGVGMGVQLGMAKPIAENELEVLIQGIRDAIHGKTLAVEEQEGRTLVQALLEERRSRVLKVERLAADEFLAAEAAKKGARTTESGLIFTELRAGKGETPTPTDRVRVHYHGTLADGSVFDSSVDRDRPSEFPLNRVIPCWTEGVSMIRVGGKARLVCPATIAYGDRSTGRIPAGAALKFEVELLEILK